MNTKLKEFAELYPDYNRGFSARNPKTKTEELLGLRMHLMYNPTRKHEYQMFSLPLKPYQSIYTFLSDGKSHHLTMDIDSSHFHVFLKLIEDNILGICLETYERIGFCLKTEIHIDESNSYFLDRWDKL